MIGSSGGLDYYDLGTLAAGNSVFLTVRRPAGSSLGPIVSLYSQAGTLMAETNGVVLSLQSVSDIFGNPMGGMSRGTTYSGLLDLGTGVDSAIRLPGSLLRGHRRIHLFDPSGPGDHDPAGSPVRPASRRYPSVSECSGGRRACDGRLLGARCFPSICLRKRGSGS